MKIGKYTLAGYVVALAVGIGLILSYGAMEASSTPAFCGTCHVMKPYYASWEVSDHSEIACVDCHIPPGITAELRKKYEAAAMVARYFTGTYGMNPWTEVEDSACLECHERRLLKGKVLFGSVLFDHGPHLTELRRGKRLRCTSCHSQIVQGSHITVTQTTCTLCHFKGQPAGEGTAECTLCHEIPKTVVSTQDLNFNHADVERFGMECTACHTPPSAESGSVPKERCLSCHNQQARLERYEDGDELHLTHVTEHKGSARSVTSRSSMWCRSTWTRRGPSARPAMAVAIRRKETSMPGLLVKASIRCRTLCIRRASAAKGATWTTLKARPGQQVKSPA